MCDVKAEKATLASITADYCSPTWQRTIEPFANPQVNSSYDVYEPVRSSRDTTHSGMSDGERDLARHKMKALLQEKSLAETELRFELKRREASIASYTHPPTPGDPIGRDFKT